MMTAPRKMLVIGDEEVESIYKVRRQLERRYNLQISLSSQKWRKLINCDVQLGQLMTPETSIVWLWALTSYAWRKVLISKGKERITVLEPNTDYSLTEIVQTVDRLVTMAKGVNNNCQVYMIIPTVKDMYKYNQTRIKQRWGNNQVHFLKHHTTLNPQMMQAHSIRSYSEFTELKQKIPLYQWTDKRVWCGNYTLAHELRGLSVLEQGKEFILRDYFRQELSSLNLPMLPDGFIVTGDFMVRLFNQVRKSFKVSEFSQDTNPQIPDDFEDTNSYIDQRPLTNFYSSKRRRVSERKCAWDTNQHQPRLQIKLNMTDSPMENFDFSEVTQPILSNFMDQPSTSATLSTYEQQLVNQQRNINSHSFPNLRFVNFTGQADLSDPQPSTSRAGFNVPSTVPLNNSNKLHLTGRPLLVPTSAPSVAVLEAAMRGVYDQLIPVGTDPQIKREVAEKIHEITLREKEMLSHMKQ